MSKPHDKKLKNCIVGYGWHSFNRHRHLQANWLEICSTGSPLYLTAFIHASWLPQTLSFLLCPLCAGLQNPSAAERKWCKSQHSEDLPSNQSLLSTSSGSLTAARHSFFQYKIKSSQSKTSLLSSLPSWIHPTAPPPFYWTTFITSSLLTSFSLISLNKILTVVTSPYPTTCPHYPI